MVNERRLPWDAGWEARGIAAERSCSLHKRSKLQFKECSAPALAWAGVLTLCGAVWNHFPWNGGRSRAGSLTLIAMAIVLGVAGLAFARREESAEFSAWRGSGNRWLLLALLALHGLLAWSLIRGTTPRIDTFILQRDASATLLQGHDPYGGSHTNVYNAVETRQFYGPGMVVNGRVQFGMVYPPVTFLSALPGYLLGDVRYGYVAAILLSTIFVFALFPDARGLWLAALVLLAPTTYFVENNCWTEPLLWLLLCATVYAAVRRPRWLPLALGLFLASKQYNFVALPFIGYLVRPFSWKAYWKLLGQSLGIALATVLPFAIWDFRSLWHDLILIAYREPVRQDALSFAVPFPLYAKIGPLLLLAFMVWAAPRRNQQAAMFAAAYGMALMLFFSGSKQAFLNYFFLIALAFWLTAASLWPARGAQLSENVRQVTVT
jgi:hypothetical protein